MFRSLSALLIAVLVAAPVAAQRAPRRPRLPSAADTNDATAYFQLGLERVERDPGQADAAFYWAGRLDPMSPQTSYARHIAALLRMDPNRLVRYLNRDPRVMDASDVRGMDSLRFRAEMQDPFVHRGMDELLLYAFVKAAGRTDEWFGPAPTGTGRSGVASGVAGTSGANSGLLAATEQFLESADPYLRGLLYYSRGQIRNALQYWGIALRDVNTRDAHIGWIYAERARAWAELRQLDSAQTQMMEAIRLRQGPNDNSDLHAYQSAAAWRYALGRILEDRRDTAAARAIYDHVVSWDPTYYPAHLRLAVIDIQQRDTAAALSRLRRAVDEPTVQFFGLASAATVYSSIGRHAEAVAALQKATTLEPFASAGWHLLGQSLALTQDSAGAVAAYQKYLALAPRNDRLRPAAERALASLTTPGP